HEAGGGHIIAATDHQHLAAQHAAEACPVYEHDRKDDVAQPGPEPDHENEREDHRGKRHPHVDDAADQPVDPAPERAGNAREHAPSEATSAPAMATRAR